MELVADEAGLLPMRGDDEPRDPAKTKLGAALKRKRMELGVRSRLRLVEISRELDMYISRDGIDAAENGTASEDTYLRYQALVKRLAETRESAGIEAASDLDSGDEDIEVTDVGNGTVEIHAKIGGDVDIVAKAPVGSLKDLKDAMSDLIREARANKESDPG